MFEFGVEAVVVRPPAPVAVDVDDEVRVRLALGDRGLGSAVGDGLGDVAPHQQVGTLVADVVELEDRAGEHLALHADDHCWTYGLRGCGDWLTARNVLAAGVARPGVSKLGNSTSEVWSGATCPKDC